MKDTEEEEEETIEHSNGFVGCRFCEAVFFRYSEVVFHVSQDHVHKKGLLPLSQWFGQSIYLIRIEGSNLCKIGVSQKPQSRLSQMNVPGLYLCLSYKVPHAYDIEKALHSYYFHKSVKGEWFDLSDEDIAALPELIRKLAQDHITRTKRSVGSLSNHIAKKKAEQFALRMAPVISTIESSGVISLQGIAAELSKLRIPKSSGVITLWQAIEVSRIKSRIAEFVAVA